MDCPGLELENFDQAVIWKKYYVYNKKRLVF